MNTKLILIAAALVSSLNAMADELVSHSVCDFGRSIQTEEYKSKVFNAKLALSHVGYRKALEAADAFSNGVPGYAKHLINRARQNGSPSLQRIKAYLEPVARDVSGNGSEVSTLIINGKLYAMSCYNEPRGAQGTSTCLSVDVLQSPDLKEAFHDQAKRLVGYPTESLEQYLSAHESDACKALEANDQRLRNRTVENESPESKRIQMVPPGNEGESQLLPRFARQIAPAF